VDVTFNLLRRDQSGSVFSHQKKSKCIYKFRGRRSVSKRAAQKFDVDRFNVSKINDMVLQCSIRLKSQIGLQLWRIGWCGHQ